MAKVLQFSTINACADKVTKVDPDLYAANLNEKTLDITLQIAALAVFTSGGLVTFLIGFYFARYAAVAVETEKPKDEVSHTEEAVLGDLKTADNKKTLLMYIIEKTEEKFKSDFVT